MALALSSTTSAKGRGQGTEDFFSAGERFESVTGRSYLQGRRCKAILERAGANYAIDGWRAETSGKEIGNVRSAVL